MDRAGWDARYRTTEVVWTANPNQLLVAEAVELSPGSALDLGAKEARIAVWLPRLHRTIDGERVAIDALVLPNGPERR